MKQFLKRLTKGWKSCTAGVLALFSVLVIPAPAHAASDAAWGAAASILSGVMAYNSTLKAILRMGNNAEAQMESRRQDLAANGQDKNALEVIAVDAVMKDLTERGAYVLPPNSLPFLWMVTDSKIFNAACYPTNYITINKGLVRALGTDKDELAMVLAHEMTHGLKQDSAHDYAKAMAAYMGLSFLNVATGAMDWNKLAGLVDYSVAKNITLPTEYEADAGGFQIASSAGYNPGGGAAAMVRMQYYLRYETTNLEEYDDQETQDLNFNDHPDTHLRIERLAQMMTAYSADHVAVREREILIDGVPLVEALRTEGKLPQENAYLAAGVLARAFHDFDSVDAWGFAGDDCAYLEREDAGLLKEFLRTREARAKLRKLVTAAYQKEAESGARKALAEREEKQRAELSKKREAVRLAVQEDVKQMRINADIYSDYGDAERALAHVNRAMSCEHQENMAENYAIRGRAHAVAGNFDAALADGAKAIAMDGKNLYNYINRADSYRMMGRCEDALGDVASAKNIDAEAAISYLLAAQIYDQMNDVGKALAEYRLFYEKKGSPHWIPDEYLKDIDAEAWEKRSKEKAEHLKKAEEAKNKISGDVKSGNGK